MKNALTSITPPWLLSAYHFSLAFLAALLYRFPSKRLVVVAVTGTKGKSSTLEYLNAIFEAAGQRTALSSTIRFKIGDRSEQNSKRQTQPGRFFLQRFLSRAADSGCDVALIEMTSEGARQFRHRFIDLDCLVFLNLAPEHIESHGSFEAYADAKFELGLQLVRSQKRPRVMVAHADDAQGARYLALPVETIAPFSLSAATPFEAGEHGGFFTFDRLKIETKLPGEFSLRNALAAASAAHALGVPSLAIQRGVAALEKIPGRAEIITDQPFLVVVDNAHTPDSLEALYKAYSARRMICVFGSMGGGRDLWKRPVMGGIAEKYCEHIILTTEDPCDEDPRSILEGIARGMNAKKPEIIIDRREAIARAVALARDGDAVLITGKGTDTSIKGPRGTSIPWSDTSVAREELQKLHSNPITNH